MPRVKLGAVRRNGLTRVGDFEMSKELAAPVSAGVLMERVLGGLSTKRVGSALRLQEVAAMVGGVHAEARPDIGRGGWGRRRIGRLAYIRRTVIP